MADRSRKLASADLRGFDQQATKLVLDMCEAGWTGYLSSKGHAIMRAPDGVTTSAIARLSTRGRTGANQRAEFERWLRARDGAVQVELADPGNDVWHICGTCGESFTTPRGLASHERTHLPSSTCPQCGKEVRYLASHQERVHGLGGAIDPVECLLGVLTEIETLRAENTQLKAKVAQLQTRIARKR